MIRHSLVALLVKDQISERAHSDHFSWLVLAEVVNIILHHCQRAVQTSQRDREFELIQIQ